MIDVHQECRPDCVGGCCRLLAQYNSDRGGRHCLLEIDAAGAFGCSAVLLVRGCDRPIGHSDGGWVCVLLDRPRPAKRARPSGSYRNRYWRVFSISFLAKRAALVWDCFTGRLLPLSVAGMEPEVSPARGSCQFRTAFRFMRNYLLSTPCSRGGPISRLGGTAVPWLSLPSMGSAKSRTLAPPPSRQLIAITMTEVAEQYSFTRSCLVAFRITGCAVENGMGPRNRSLLAISSISNLHSPRDPMIHSAPTSACVVGRDIGRGEILFASS